MINIRLVQVSFTSLYSIFMFDNFLPEDYLKHLSNVVKEKTGEDCYKRKFAVQANMTSFEEFLNDSEFEMFRLKVVEHLNYILMLRSPSTHCKIQYTYRDFWGMQHRIGDYSKLHDHNMSDWSGSFYLNVPCDTKIYFPDLKYEESILQNTLYLFPSLMKHEVSTHTHEESRLSVAFNINTNYDCDQ